jgi:hypothetical protein
MNRLRMIALLGAASLSGCGSLYGDDGAAEPGSVWPWVCPDGSPAPDSGCPPVSPCEGGVGADGDGDC